MRSRFSKKLPAPVGVLFILLAGILWGSMGLFVRYFTACGLSSLNIVACRIFFTVLILLPITAVVSPSSLRVRLRDCWCFVGTGLLSIVFFNLCYFSTIRSSSLATAAVLLYTAPIIVTLLSVPLFHEKLTVRKIAGCAAAFAGCVLVSGVGGLSFSPAALLTGLGSGVGYALYTVFGRFALDRGYSSLTVTVYTFLFAAVSMLFLTDFPQLFSVLSDSPLPIVVGLAMGLCVSILPYLLYTAGLTAVEAGTASVMASVEPVTAALVGLAVYHEIPGAAEAVGMVMVLGAILILNGRNGKQDAG